MGGGQDCFCEISSFRCDAAEVFGGVMQRTLVVFHRRFWTTYRILSPTVKQSKNNARQRVDSLLYEMV